MLIESPFDCSLCNSISRYFKIIRYNNKENLSSYRYRVFLLNSNTSSVQHKIIIQQHLIHYISCIPKYIIIQSSSSILPPEFTLSLLRYVEYIRIPISRSFCNTWTKLWGDLYIYIHVTKYMYLGTSPI